MSGNSSSEDWRRRQTKYREEALAAFPYELVQVNGDTALGEWEKLKREGRGAPVVIGSDEALEALSTPFHPGYWSNRSEPILAETLAKADRLTHPESLLTYQKEEEERIEHMLATDSQRRGVVRAFQAWLGEIGIRVDPTAAAPVGWWPLRPPAPTALTVIENWETDRPFDTVYIVLVPTDDWTAIPAYLRWGNWNVNPPAEYHVAALRSWRERYGAELIGLSFDVMNIRVANKPSTRNEAMLLAREHYAYCNDIVDQGVGNLSKLAASLKAHDWWYFWWD